MRRWKRGGRDREERGKEREGIYREKIENKKGIKKTEKTEEEEVNATVNQKNNSIKLRGTSVENVKLWLKIKKEILLSSVCKEKPNM